MIKKINKLSILYPGGNTTAIVQDSANRVDQPLVSRLICQKYKNVEQVGFLEKPKNKKTIARLQMVGGEFSGNAALCIAFLSLKSGQTGYVEISGVKKPLKSKRSNKLTACQMPVRLTEPSQTQEGFTFIKLDGIYQIIVNNFYDKTNQQLIKKSRQIIKNNKLENKLATVISFTKKVNNKIYNKPFCYFRKDFQYQVFKETSCGSASTALGINEFFKSGKKKFEIVQPTGCSTFVEIKNNQVWIKTQVKLIYQGDLKL